MKCLFLQPPMGGWVTWGNHIAININHAQLAANLREWFPEIEIKVLDCRALGIDEKGMVKRVDAIRSSPGSAGYGFVKEAKEAIFKWRFLPAKIRGVPVSVWCIQDVRFELKDVG